jgi:hypothetical protein
MYETGKCCALVVAWSQTEIDGLAGSPPESLHDGSCWRWSGRAVSLSGIGTLGDQNQDDLRQSTAKTVRKLIGGITQTATDVPYPDLEIREDSFTVTDGQAVYVITLIEVPGTKRPLLMFAGLTPPADTDLWVMARQLRTKAKTSSTQFDSGVICFTSGTMIRTEIGTIPVEALAQGDKILTRDNGPQAVRWIGQRRMSGARLHVMPSLRPIRIAAGAIGDDVPDADLLVSPEHRLLVKGRAAMDLFNTDEVLVAARDLVDDRLIRVDRSATEVTYFHLMFDAHQVLWANGVPSESFQPTLASLEQVDPLQRNSLAEQFPYIVDNPATYSTPARRVLTEGEAALLRYGFTANH